MENKKYTSPVSKACLAFVIIFMVMFLFNVYWTTKWGKIYYNGGFDGWDIPLGIQEKLDDKLDQVLDNQQKNHMPDLIFTRGDKQTIIGNQQKILDNQKVIIDLISSKLTPQV